MIPVDVDRNGFPGRPSNSHNFSNGATIMASQGSDHQHLSARPAMHYPHSRSYWVAGVAMAPSDVCFFIDVSNCVALQHGRTKAHVHTVF